MNEVKNFDLYINLNLTINGWSAEDGRAISRDTKGGHVLLVARYRDCHILLGIGY